MSFGKAYQAVLLSLILASLCTSVLAQSDSVDDDGDGYCEAATCTDGSLPHDCNDDDNTIHPGAIDIPGNDLDENCDDTVACYVDADDDQFGTASSAEVTAYTATGGFADTTGICDSSSSDGYADTSSDCDDANSFVHPGAIDDPADDYDENCSGYLVCFDDADSDGYGTTTSSESLFSATGGVANTPGACGSSAADLWDNNDNDCNDANSLVNPGAIDDPGNDLDENCSNTLRCYDDDDSDGYGIATSAESTFTATDGVADTTGACGSSNSDVWDDSSDDCDGSRSSIHPGAIDIPGDDYDQNCSGTVVCFDDADSDGYGATTSAESTFTAIGGVSPNNACGSTSHDVWDDSSDDCEDSNDNIYPDAPEVCGDGIDANCDDIGGPLGDEDEDGCSWTEEDAAGTSDCADDSDNDLLDDFIEMGGNCAYDAGETDPFDDDSDNDNLLDGEEDRNANGVWDGGETDALDADTDDDGVADGAEDVNANGAPDANETDPLDPDTDGDFLNDGLELGLTSGVPAGTSTSGYPYAGTSGFTPDTDPSSMTDPIDDDTDNDGINDGTEDANGNGNVNAAETDPADADTDDDGVADLDESTMLLDSLDPDSDNDGLNDGLEIGRNTPVPDGTSSGLAIAYDGTNIGAWTPDSNPATVTDPLDTDSDNDGLEDGLSEDLNGNGQVDGVETDPADADSDDDGIEDGDEPALGLDPLDDDSDSDELNDGLEMGRTQPIASGTSSGAYAPNRIPYLGTNAGAWSPDSDNSTTTDPDDSDSDNDLLNDGVEDADHNGAVDAAETDPNDQDSDDDTLLDGIEDTDLDGVKDANESDPLDPDTDDDGWCDDSRTDNDGDGIDPSDSCDGSEVDSGTSPILADTDSDTNPDPLDNCPLDYNPEQLDANSDGVGDVCDQQNICFDPNTELQGEDYTGIAYCAAADSIVAGGVDPEFVPVDGQEFGVLIAETGRVVFSAPIIELVPPFEVATGGTFSAGLSLAPLCDLMGFSATGQAVQQDPIFYYALSSASDPYDALVIELSAPASVGTFQLTGENYVDCEQCVTAFTGCTDGLGCEKTFLASDGTLTVTSIDSAFQGSLEGLELQEVTIDPETYVSTLVPDGSTYCISSWDFSAPFVP